MKILEATHWSIPWIILAIGLTGIYRFTRSHLDEKPFTVTDRKWVAVFSGLMDLQGTVGLLFFFWSGFSGEGFPMYRILHAIIMFISAGIPHYFIREGRAKESGLHLHYFYMFLTSFLVMLVGLSVIPA